MPNNQADNEKKTIIFTGGGSAGHVTPNIALIKRFRSNGWEVHYIGSETGIEREIIEPLGIPYHPISTGKLRRYLTWRHLLMPFQVLKGIWQSFMLCRTIKPKVIFSKGAFVSLPVVIGAWLNKIPVLIHEADITPGLANKLSAPFAQKIFITNEVAKKYYKNQNKVLITGIPMRDELFQGDKQRGLAFCNFSSDKPVILVFGGSLGSASLNKNIRALLPKLLSNFQVAHICGKNKIDESLKQNGYAQFEYVHKEMSDLFAMSDLVISRAGANSVYELLSLKKPHILIPLPTTASRGDQIDNAKYYQERNLSNVIFEEALTEETLLDMIQKSFAERESFIERMENYQLPDSVSVIEERINATVRGQI